MIIAIIYIISLLTVALTAHYMERDDYRKGENFFQVKRTRMEHLKTYASILIPLFNSFIALVCIAMLIGELVGYITKKTKGFWDKEIYLITKPKQDGKNK